MQRFITFLTLLSIVYSHFSLAVEGIADITITQTSKEEKNMYCQWFALNAEEAGQFFSKGHIASPDEVHYQYDYLPCYVKGHLRFENKSCEFEIRSGATGHIKCRGEPYIDVVCDKCQDMFDGSGPDDQEYDQKTYHWAIKLKASSKHGKIRLSSLEAGDKGEGSTKLLVGGSVVKEFPTANVDIRVVPLAMSLDL